MRQDTAVILTKGISHVCIGFFAPWSAALAQWANAGEWPHKIIWVGIILPLSVVGGFTQLLAFLSGSYAKYLESKEPLKAAADEAEILKAQQAAAEKAKLLAATDAAKLEEVKAGAAKP